MNSNQFICPECERELDVDSWECPSCTGSGHFDEPFSGESIDEEEEESWS